jgi:YVTN family beta-propeller protein
MHKTLRSIARCIVALASIALPLGLSAQNKTRVGQWPYLTITPHGTRAYVSSVDTGEVWVIDTSNNTVVDKVTVGNRGLKNIAITP